MKKSSYSCDCGSIAIAINNNLIRFTNGIGDGTFDIFIFEDFNEFNKFTNTTDRQFFYITSCEFEGARLLNSDTPTVSALKERAEEFTICKLNGTYHFFNTKGDILIVKGI